ncbi:MAG: glutathione peroxidase [Pseudomonadales bacterium 32-61-5]|nr:MAG: glutathione peroxidase [Pseudomonadales bacterium 32-61-5]
MDKLYDIPVRTIDGRDTSLADYAGKALLIVNTASKCGLTPQYEGLAALYRTYRERGLEILGFPSNDFRGQEPGEDAEIADFCRVTYEVDFPMFSKIGVAGQDKHALYAALIEARPVATTTSSDAMRSRLKSHGIDVNPPPEVQWNFEKFLVSPDGTVIARFAPDTLPEDTALVSAIEAALPATFADDGRGIPPPSL